MAVNYNWLSAKNVHTMSLCKAYNLLRADKDN
jgi:hypothetical protein